MIAVAGNTREDATARLVCSCEQKSTGLRHADPPVAYYHLMPIRVAADPGDRPTEMINRRERPRSQRVLDWPTVPRDVARQVYINR